MTYIDNKWIKLEKVAAVVKGNWVPVKKDWKAILIFDGGAQLTLDYVCFNELIQEIGWNVEK